MNKLWTVVIVAVVAGGVWWMLYGGSGTPDSYMPSASPTNPVTQGSKTPTPIATTVSVGTPTPLPTPAKSYSELVTQFGSNRIQFDTTCQAQPKSASFKNGTSILLDNRSNMARTITLNGTRYALGAFGYQVITLPSPATPQTLGLSCDNNVNVGTIQLQANISGQR